MQSRHSRHSRASMRPDLSIASDSQPTAQASQGPHSFLRLSPHQRKVDGTARLAPSGHRYLQNGRSTNSAAPRSSPQNVTKGHDRFHTPTRKVVLNGSTSAIFSARGI